MHVVLKSMTLNLENYQNQRHIYHSHRIEVGNISTLHGSIWIRNQNKIRACEPTGKGMRNV